MKHRALKKVDHIGPRKGERVLICPHDHVQHWYSYGGEVARADGQRFLCNWFGLCEKCHFRPGKAITKVRQDIVLDENVIIEETN